MLNDLQTDCIGTVRWTEKGVPDVTKKIKTNERGNYQKKDVAKMEQLIGNDPYELHSQWNYKFVE